MRRVKQKKDVQQQQYALNPPVWIDLGCGTSKLQGFVGIDRFPMPGVDVVCDLDEGIPIASDSVDHVLASHSLEHLRDLPGAMAEIYRICKDRAVVTIIAPYDATRLNRANPYHFQVWNEHTARFFTENDASLLKPQEFSFPCINVWGLSASDHGRSDVDLRCLRMEFHYFPPYRRLDEQTKRTLRQSLSDVCDQMALDLLVVKSPITQDEVSRRAATIQYPVHPAFEARRHAEANTSEQNLFSEIAAIPARVTALSASTNEEIALLGTEMRRFIERVDHVDRALVIESEEIARLSDQTGQFVQRVDHVERALVIESEEIARLSDQTGQFVQRVDHVERALVAQGKEAAGTVSELVSIDRRLSERITAVNASMSRQLQATGEVLRSSLSDQLHSTLDAGLLAKTDELRTSIADQLHSTLDAGLLAKTDELRTSIAEQLHSTLDARLIAKTDELRTSIAEQLHSALDARLVAKSEELAEGLRATLCGRHDQVAAELRTQQARSFDSILTYLVAERRARADLAFRPIRFLRRFRQRATDLSKVIGGNFLSLWNGPEAQRSRKFKLQLGTFFVPGVARTYPLAPTDLHLSGIEIGINAIFPPSEATIIADCELLDHHGDRLRTAVLAVDESCLATPSAVTFDALPRHSSNQLVLKLTPRASAARIGVQVFEWHRVSVFLRRVLEQRLAYRTRYAPSQMTEDSVD